MTDSERSYSATELRTVAYMAAGAGAAEVMRLAPTVVMPTEDIERCIEQLLATVREDGVPE